MLYPLNYGGLYEIYESYASAGYPLFLHEKVHQGASQGAKIPQALWQARVFAVSLVFSRVFTHITKGEQHLRRGMLYPLNYEGVACCLVIITQRHIIFKVFY